jgi:hypothetical protein
MPNYEYMHSALRTWGEMLHLNEQHKNPCGPNPFLADRSLTKGEVRSEQLFVMACAGMVHAEKIVGKKLVEAFSASAPVDAWRHAVLRSSYRKDLNALDALIQKNLSGGKRDAVVSAFPSGYDAGKIREALHSFGWQPRKTGMPELLRLLDAAEARQKNAPAYEMPQP